MNRQIKVAKSDEDIENCYPVMAQLHEKLKRDEFVNHVRRLEAGGYNLACLIDNDEVKSVVGFHFGESIAWERYLYVDDLVTDENSRSSGYGKELLEWINNLAREHGCDQLHLDSRVTRYATHKFYLNQGLILGGYHFLKTVDD